MSRLESIFGAVVLVCATILVTEWVHYRQGDATLWSVVQPGPGLSLVAGENEPGPVTEGEFERYVAVLERMQADRGLSIDEAVSHEEEMSLETFRDIEQRVQRSGLLVERVRERLRQTAERIWDSRVATREAG